MIRPWRIKRIMTSVLAGIVLLAISVSPLQAGEDDTWAARVNTGIADVSLAADDDEEAAQELRRLSRELQALKTEVIEINHELRLLEEQLLFPSSTKYTVFVSLSSGQFFELESVKLQINGRVVATHVYSDRQRRALLRGGTHRLYVTNLAPGTHTATAFFTGVGSGGRPYRRATTIDFKKGDNSGYLEIAVGDDQRQQEPVFAIKQW
jgi:hypothetical protein